jgi:hypothetical protein
MRLHVTRLACFGRRRRRALNQRSRYRGWWLSTWMLCFLTRCLRIPWGLPSQGTSLPYYMASKCMFMAYLHQTSLSPLLNSHTSMRIFKKLPRKIAHTILASWPNLFALRCVNILPLSLCCAYTCLSCSGPGRVSQKGMPRSP